MSRLGGRDAIYCLDKKVHALAHSSTAQMSSPNGALVDGFGCPFDRLYKNQTISSADLKIFRKGTLDIQLEQIVTCASDRGFAIGISMHGGHSRRIFSGHRADTHHFEENAIYIRDLADDYKADVATPFDFLLLEISPAALERLADAADLPGVTLLAAETASKDIVLANLARVFIPALERPREASALFVDQMATAVGSYLVQRYGSQKSVPVIRPRKLSRAHELLAKNLLLDKLDGDISVQDVASACNLSRGYFIRAFRETTGVTPYQWLLNERVARARELLRDGDLSLSEVAISCGFADQSHFTRVFTGVVGTTPGNWRRNS